MTSPTLAIEVLAPEGSVAKILAPSHVTARPVTIGSQGDVVVLGEGVAPEHLFVLVREGTLYVSSADTVVPAVLDRTSLPTQWVSVGAPCCIRLGEVIIRLFWCRRATNDATMRLRCGPLPRASLPARRSPPSSPLSPRSALGASRRSGDEEITLVSLETRMPRSQPAARMMAPCAETAPSTLDVPDGERTSRRPSEPTLVAPIAPPRASPRRTSLQTPPVEGRLFHLASRAVDAWNRFVEAVDEKDQGTSLTAKEMPRLR